MQLLSSSSIHCKHTTAAAAAARSIKDIIFGVPVGIFQEEEMKQRYRLNQASVAGRLFFCCFFFFLSYKNGVKAAR